MPHGTWVISCLAVACVSLAPATGRACSPPQCRPGNRIPGGQSINVPANQPGIFWSPSDGNMATTDDVLVVQTDDDAIVPFELVEVGVSNSSFLYDVQFLEPLIEGTSYTLTFADSCLPSEHHWIASDPLPLPKQLGTLVVSTPEHREVYEPSSIGSCSDITEAVAVDVSLDPTAEAAVWFDGFVFETLVDGTVWHPNSSITADTPAGESWEGRGQDVVFATCVEPETHATQGLKPGVHSIQMRARVPGTHEILESDVVEVTLECEGESETDAESGSDSDNATETAGSDTGADTDDETTDASTTDASTAGGLPEPEGGCGCRTGSGAPPLLSALLLLAFVRPRRR